MRLGSLVGLLLIACACSAQEPAFVVIEVSGNVTTAQNRKVLVGAKMADNTVINVAPGARIALACRNSGGTRFSSPGRYTVRSADYCKPVNDPAFANLCRYAWKQVTGKDHEESWNRHTENIGAVSRGAPCAATVSHYFSNIAYAEGDLRLMWSASSPGAPLYLKVYKKPNTPPVLELPVAGSRMPLSGIAGQLKEGTYYWAVNTREGDCEASNLLHIVSTHHRDSVVAADVQAVTTNVADPAAQKYWTAVMLESDHFVAEAYTFYTEAAKIAPAEQRYTQELKAFKKHYGF